MSDGMILMIGKDGVAREYKDDYDVVIHCESKEEQDKVIEYLNEHAPTTAPTTDHTTADPNDCISRQQAIDALDKRFDNIPMEKTSEILLLRRDLRTLPPVQPELCWTPCSKKPPEEYGTYNVTVDQRYIPEVSLQVDTLFWHDGEWWYDLDGQDVVFPYPVIAWMPLPKPYKEET